MGGCLVETSHWSTYDLYAMCQNMTCPLIPIWSPCHLLSQLYDVPHGVMWCFHVETSHSSTYALYATCQNMTCPLMPIQSPCHLLSQLYYVSHGVMWCFHVNIVQFVWSWHVSPFQWWDMSPWLWLFSLFDLNFDQLYIFHTKYVWGDFCVIGKLSPRSTQWITFWENLRWSNFEHLWILLDLCEHFGRSWTFVRILGPLGSIKPAFKD